MTLEQQLQLRKGGGGGAEQCNGSILPPQRKRQRQAKAAWRFLHRGSTNTPLLLARSAEAGCLRYIAGASLNTHFGYIFI